MKNQISAYDLACGGVQKEEFNNHWLELYREHNCYHVRMGKNGGKWSSWESFDSGYKSPLKLARECYRDFLDEIKNPKTPKCNQCDSATINGHYCHEQGCPNIGKIWNFEDESWDYPEDEDFGQDGQVD